MENTRHAALQRLTAVAVFAAILAVCSQIAIPLPVGVPITLQTFAVALCGYCLGVPSALSAVAVYLALGAVGVPVFASLGAGTAVLLGKTGGFLFGFLPMVLLCSLGRKQKAILGIGFGIVGILACHLFGAAWFAVLTGNGLWQSIVLVSLPYLVKDILSAAVAYFFAAKLRRIIPALR